MEIMVTLALKIIGLAIIVWAFDFMWTAVMWRSGVVHYPKGGNAILGKKKWKKGLGGWSADV